jgi:tetratricopeptide (TPR) repeat protein
LLFLLSAVCAAWLAYDQVAGWGKFLPIVGGLAVYYGIVQTPEKIYMAAGRHLLRLFLLILPSALAVYFLMTNDWPGEMGNPSLLDPIRRWLGEWEPVFRSDRLNPNGIGGIIAVYVPLQIAAMGLGRRSHVASWVVVPLLCLSGLGLLMSSSRGAWLALAVAATGWALGSLSERQALRGHTGRPVSHTRDLWIIVPVLGGLIIFLVLLATPVGAWLHGMDGDRISLWRNSLDLASDYPFSGLGLASFEMPYSSYVFLLHVGFQTYGAHNLLLDVWLEQGLLGLLALLWLLAAALWPNQPASYWRQPALASLAVLLLHGLVDDVFYGGDGAGIFLLFVPFALLAGPAESSGPTPQKMSALKQANPRLTSFLGSALALLAMAALLLLPSWRAALQANLGALAQTRAELSVYDSPEWLIQDALRRSSKIDLAPALAHYQAALARDPANATANRRLGQIELSLGQYEAARKHLETAYVVAPDQRATRQLLGESYAVAGEVERAADMWRTVEMRQGQLRLRQWWYEHIGESQRAAWVAEGAK